ncbi:MAG: tetratricopeptide repeat protein [Alphaproteobacteria bacterium]|nr:tetratricopeptide repeat protein [Alphaproteobacteria bacterium]
MQNENILLTLDIYYGHLHIINDITFTPREIDIIACILNRRATSISAFLSIGSRAVETHTRNIRLKAGGLSGRESIINFIEKSGKLSLIKNEYYVSLRGRVFFEEKLKNISQERSSDIPTCLFVYERGQQYKTSLMIYLKEHLKRVGFKIETHISDDYSFLTNPHNTLNFQKIVHIIYLIPKQTETSSWSSADFKSLEKTIFLSQGESHDPNLKRVHPINILENGNYYISFFKVLKKMLPNKNIDRIIEDFIKQQQEIFSDSGGSLQHTSSKLQMLGTPSLSKVTNKNLYSWLTSSSKRRMATITAILSLTGVSVFILTKIDNPVTNNSAFISNANIETIQSDLFIPSQITLLNRPEMLAEIKDKLKGQEGIQTVSLIGCGGAGKTTLARQYARQQNDGSIIWEINAETSESLKEAFDNLAQRLAKTEEDQKSLRGLQDIKAAKEREGKILQFVKEHLRTYPDWLLIYDNVEDFSNILKYFPHDMATWGQGTVILTTRNSNIQSNKYINAFISVGELNPSQKRELFTKIMNSERAHSFRSYQNEETHNFLEKIPSFPLDVTVAAHYLKTTNSSYKEYLENLYKNDKIFSNIQENLLKESGDYYRIRYNIITLSLKHILDIQHDFDDLLLFISLLDSQNIPRELLIKIKDPTVVDNFIYHLNKHSLITQGHHPIPTLSIHRSTQAISLVHLLRKLNLPKKNEIIRSLVDSFEKYAYEIVDSESLTIMRLLATHAGVLLKHGNLLDEDTRGSVTGVLGCIYAYLGNYQKSLQLLNESIANLKKGGSKNHIKIAEFLPYLGTVYLMLGNYEEALCAFEKSLIIFKKYRFENNIAAARVLANLGNVYRDIGDYNKAIDHLEKSFDICNKILPENHPKIGAGLVILGNVYRALGNYEKAINLLKRGFVIYQLHFPKDHSGIGWILCHLGITYTALENYDEASNCLEKSLIIYKKQFHETHIWTSWVLTQLGVLYSKKGNYEKGIKLLENNLITFNKTYGKDHTETARILMNLGQAYLLQSNFDIAESYLKKALKIFEKNKHPDNHMVLETLAELCLKKSSQEQKNDSAQQIHIFKKQAINYLNQSLELVKNHFPKDSPHLTKILLKLEKLK